MVCRVPLPRTPSLGQEIIRDRHYDLYMKTENAAGVSARYDFASDNTAGVCPEAWEAMVEANAAGPVASYGDDGWTRRASDLFREVFETECDVYFVFNGTAANSLALASLCQSYHSVICHEKAHIETDECGAPEFYSNGSKLLVCSGPNGKLDPAAVRELATKRTDLHFPRARALSLTQATELGTVYTPSEIGDLCDLAKGLGRQVGKVGLGGGLRVHMDGARFANAVASIGKSPAELTWKVGVDVVCFGGTKNGMAVGEAVVFFDRELSAEFAYRCKQAGQLASKMRFMAAPWVGMLKDGMNAPWIRHAAHANAMASRLSQGLTQLGVPLLVPTQANGVFAELPVPVAQGLQAKGWKYYTFIGAGGARFMCSWATTTAQVDSLLGDVRTLLTA